MKPIGYEGTLKRSDGMSENIFNFENEADFVQDREDLLALLKMRFDSIPTGVVEAIYQISSLDDLERLILVAANAPTFKIFLEELDDGQGSFRIIGERFNPIEITHERGGVSGEE